MATDRSRHRSILGWESGAHLAVCLAAVLAAGWARTMLASSGTAKWDDLKAKVGARASADGVPGAVRNDVAGLLEIGDEFISIFRGSCAVILVLGVAGSVREARTLLVTRPLLADGAED